MALVLVASVLTGCQFDGSGGTAFLLRNVNGPGTPDVALFFGPPFAVPLAGDWNGDGIDTPGYRVGSNVYLRNSNRGGAPEFSFSFGEPFDDVFVGDWDGDGIDTLGIRRGNVWALRADNAVRSWFTVFEYGAPTDVPLVGDWDGDGRDTPGVHRGEIFHLWNPAGTFFAQFGIGTDRVMAGDWNGDGIDTIGLQRGTTFFQRNSNTSGPPDGAWDFGGDGALPVAGDWNGDGIDTVGVAVRSPQTPILGAPVKSLAQARAWAARNGAPDWFVGLADVYYALAPSRGVRADVAYAQSALETGFGRFGGVIDATWNNPCGLKTTAGGGNADPSAHQAFPDWGTGVAACLDHLGLYAGGETYPRPGSPDPRHFPQIAGTAPTVELLGGRWAPSPDYGVNLVTRLLAAM